MCERAKKRGRVRTYDVNERIDTVQGRKKGGARQDVTLNLGLHKYFKALLKADKPERMLARDCESIILKGDGREGATKLVCPIDE
jgi:hypothetical protein